MNKYLSEKLKVISFISVVMVVFLHSYNISPIYDFRELSNDYSFFIQNLISNGFTKVAVPIFFATSGYLFFLKFKGNVFEYTQELRKRVKTLLIPFLIWSAAGFILYLILQQIPPLKVFFNHELVSSYSAKKILTKLFIQPIPYQLWFLRDLILLVLFSPIILLVIRQFRLVPLVLLLLYWFNIYNNCYGIDSGPILFFSLGAYFSLHKKDFVLIARTEKYYSAFFFFWIAIVLTKTTLMQLNYGNLLILLLLHKLSILTGVFAVWTMYDLFTFPDSKFNRKILELSGYTFFTFAFHEPTLTIIKKSMFYALGKTDLVSTINYFLAPIVTITVSILMAKVIRSKFSNIYTLITGNR